MSSQLAELARDQARRLLGEREGVAARECGGDVSEVAPGLPVTECLLLLLS